MSTVSFKRSPNVNTIPIVDGQLIFDETNNKIYMDNGDQRLQYGGDVSLISNPDYATNNNVFSAAASKILFTSISSVVDLKDVALAVTENHIPVGCKAFQSTIGIEDYSVVGNTISSSLVTLNNKCNKHTNQLTANNEDIYFDYQNGKYGINTSSTRGADTFVPFKNIEQIIQVLPKSLSTGYGQLATGSGHFAQFGAITLPFDGTVTVKPSSTSYEKIVNITLGGNSYRMTTDTPVILNFHEGDSFSVYLQCYNGYNWLSVGFEWSESHE